MAQQEGRKSKYNLPAQEQNTGCEDHGSTEHGTARSSQSYESGALSHSADEVKNLIYLL